MPNRRNEWLFSEAQKVIPGGVNSPVRAFKSVGGTPVFVSSAQGPWLISETGKEYLDYIASWGPLMFGHAHPPIVEAIASRIRQGISFGTPTELETQIAQKVVSLVPNIDKVRFVNSGTEACMSAIRLARGVTGRDKIIKFEGCYHGHSDSFLIKAGSGAATLGEPNSLGVTKSVAQDTLTAGFNDLASVGRLVDAYPNEIAGIIIEPVAGNMGCIPPKEGFLKGLRALCDKHGILLIFDEVMTGFRLSMGGAQELFKIKADIVTFGKVIGGGMPVGAFAAGKEIMSFLAPEGPVYQAGTLSGNPVAMSAGLAMLQCLEDEPIVYKKLADKTNYLTDAFRRILEPSGLPHTINKTGSMMSVHFTDSEVVDFPSAAKGDNALFKAFFHGMLDKGIYLPPSPYESWFLNDSLSYENLDATIEAFKSVIGTLAKSKS